jgi:hydrogenase/urease accessory protein HupE
VALGPDGDADGREYGRLRWWVLRVEGHLVSNRARGWVIGLATPALALLPGSAEAHLVTTGLGPIYDGVSHVLMSPEDLIPIVAMAMFAALNGRQAGRRSLFALTASWLAGGGAGYIIGQPVASAATTFSILLLGALTAADARMPPRLVTCLAIAVGLLHGWLNGAGIAAAQREPGGLVGIAIATFVVVALVAATVVSLRAAWMRIAVRVVGSWVMAIGLLMLGWTLRTVAG